MCTLYAICGAIAHTDAAITKADLLSAFVTSKIAIRKAMVGADKLLRGILRCKAPAILCHRSEAVCECDCCGTDCRAPAGAVDTILTYCHNNLADQTLLDLLPYLHEKGVGVISASFSSMGLLRKEVSPLHICMWSASASCQTAECLLLDLYL